MEDEVQIRNTMEKQTDVSMSKKLASYTLH